MTTLPTLTGKHVYDARGEDIGDVTDVLFDGRAQEPVLVTVNPGLFRRERLVPVALLTERNGCLVSAAPRDEVLSGPKARSHVEPRPDEQAAIFAHYGLASPR